MDEHQSDLVRCDAGIEAALRRRGNRSAPRSSRPQAKPPPAITKVSNCRRRGRIGLEIGVFELVDHVARACRGVGQALDREGMNVDAGHAREIRYRSHRQHEVIERERVTASRLQCSATTTLRSRSIVFTSAWRTAVRFNRARKGKTMCLGSIEPEGTSGKSGVNVKKFSLSIRVISARGLRRSNRSRCNATVVPANPPPRIRMRIGFVMRRRPRE